MTQLSDMLLSMTSSVSDLGTALKAYIAKNKAELADKNLTITTLQEEVAQLESAQTDANAEAESFKDAQISKLQDQIDESLKRHAQTTQEKDEALAKLQQELDEASSVHDKKDAQIAALQKAVDEASSKQSETEQEKDTQLVKLQQEADEATEMYLKISEEKDRTQKLLYTEMNKVDQIQMELELAERERDIALRKQGINSEQKQLLAKMEHEGYKINETIERIEHISDMIKDILLEETDAEDLADLEKKRLENA